MTRQSGTIILQTLLTIILATNITPAFAQTSSSYFDHGLIYSGSKYPQSVAQAIHTPPPADLDKLKSGEATTRNILCLIETGDAGIKAAAKNGGITKIEYVDTKIEKVYVPLLFIPIYVKETKTVVYGN